MPVPVCFCPECGEEFELNDFDAAKSPNIFNCPECETELEQTAYDPLTGNVEVTLWVHLHPKEAEAEDPLIAADEEDEEDEYENEEEEDENEDDDDGGTPPCAIQ